MYYYMHFLVVAVSICLLFICISRIDLKPKRGRDRYIKFVNKRVYFLCEDKSITFELVKL